MTEPEHKSVTFAQCMQRLKFRLHEQTIRQLVTEIFIIFILFWGVVRRGGPYGSESVDRTVGSPQTRSLVGGPRTGGQCFRVTL